MLHRRGDTYDCGVASPCTRYLGSPANNPWPALSFPVYDTRDY
jgi:hypothetical protein